MEGFGDWNGLSVRKEHKDGNEDLNFGQKSQDKVHPG